MDSRILAKRRMREKRRRQKIRNNISAFFKLALLGIVVFLIINTFILAIITVDGNSMNPTIEHGEKIAFSKLGVSSTNIERGDIVLFKGKDNVTYIKRVIGLPGEFVEIEKGSIYINGRKFEEDVSKEYTHHYNITKWYLQEGEFFVLGDNRAIDDSKDSRVFGPVNIDMIEGKFLTRFGF